mmetsp:Transcript_16927/g.44770  ORF Transcript_16927/g.44770 Transcript_16927/m.44770 type:complete len:556 (-) Transcript_16927:196-1863(-)
MCRDLAAAEAQKGRRRLKGAWRLRRPASRACGGRRPGGARARPGGCGGSEGAEAPEQLLADHGPLLVHPRRPEHRRVLLRPADQVGHHLVDGPVGHVLVGLEALPAQRVGQVVGHAQQLPEVDLALVLAQLLHAAHRVLDRPFVVRGDEDLGAPAGPPGVVRQDRVDGGVEVGLGVRVGLADGRLRAALPRLLSLRDHVGAAHDLAAEVPPFAVRPLEVAQDAAVHALQVRLVGLEDDRAVPAVVYPLQEDHHVVYRRLDVHPLGVHHHPDAELLREVHDGLYTIAEVPVQPDLLLVQGGFVHRPLLPAASLREGVDLREAHALCPLPIRDDTVAVGVELIELPSELLLVLHDEQLGPALPEGLPVQPEGPVHAIVGLPGHLGRLPAVGHGLEEAGGLRQAGGHALQQRRVPQSRHLHGGEAIGRGVLDRADGVHDDPGVRVAESLALVDVLERAEGRPDCRRLVHGLLGLGQRVVLGLSRVVQDGPDAVAPQVLHARHYLGRGLPGAEVVEEGVPQSHVRERGPQEPSAQPVEGVAVPHHKAYPADFEDQPGAE